MKANLIFWTTFLMPVIDTFAEFESQTLEDGQALDCLGLGKQANQILEWFFKKRPDKDVPVDFRFFSRNNRRSIDIPQNKGFIVEDIDFDIRKGTVFIVHGFMSNGRSGWTIQMKNSFLNWDDLNVFVVDWGMEANEWNYLKAAVNTQTIAQQMMRLIDSVTNVTTKSMPDYSQWGSIYCVGHSLGAHICGYVAKLLKQQNHPWNMTRISGLDPAAPCFKHATDDLFLQGSDADFVDIIHTDGGNGTFGLGMKNATGSVDFYPNGGDIQPGCDVRVPMLIRPMIPLPIRAIKKVMCSHGRAYKYFIESINSNAMANKCPMYGYEWNMKKTRSDLQPILEKALSGVPGCTELGINAQNYLCRGQFLVVVAPSSPYCNIASLSEEELIKKMTNV